MANPFKYEIKFILIFWFTSLDFLSDLIYSKVTEINVILQLKTVKPYLCVYKSNSFDRFFSI